MKIFISLRIKSDLPMFRPVFLVTMLATLYSFSQEGPKLITRNKKKPVEINGMIIRQDNKNIGFIKLLEQYNNGRPATVYQVFLPNGSQIATAFAYGKRSHQWMVTILEDPSVSFDVDSKQNYDKRDIAEILIKNGYL